MSSTLTEIIDACKTIDQLVDSILNVATTIREATVTTEELFDVARVLAAQKWLADLDNEKVRVLARQWLDIDEDREPSTAWRESPVATLRGRLALLAPILVGAVPMAADLSLDDSSYIESCYAFRAVP